MPTRNLGSQPMQLTNAPLSFRLARDTCALEEQRRAKWPEEETNRFDGQIWQTGQCRGSACSHYHIARKPVTGPRARRAEDASSAYPAVGQSCVAPTAVQSHVSCAPNNVRSMINTTSGNLFHPCGLTKISVIQHPAHGRTSPFLPAGRERAGHTTNYLGTLWIWKLLRRGVPPPLFADERAFWPRKRAACII